MELKLYNVKGEEKGSVSLDDAVFGVEVSYGCIYHAVNNELANRRVGTACTKTRAEVNYSNTKPFKQKGTGNARQGDKKSPVRVGGGTIFGPRPRDYSYSLPKKMKRNAMKSLLSLAVKEGKLIVVENFKTTGKTKEMQSVLDSFSCDSRTVFIMGGDDELMRRSARNIPNLRILAFDKLSAKELFYGRKIILSEAAVSKLSEFYNRTEVAK